MNCPLLIQTPPYSTKYTLIGPCKVKLTFDNSKAIVLSTSVSQGMVSSVHMHGDSLTVAQVQVLYSNMRKETVISFKLQ